MRVERKNRKNNVCENNAANERSRGGGRICQIGKRRPEQLAREPILASQDQSCTTLYELSTLAPMRYVYSFLEVICQTAPAARALAGAFSFTRPATHPTGSGTCRAFHGDQEYARTISRNTSPTMLRNIRAKSRYATPTANDAPVLATRLPTCSNGTRTSERRRMAASRHIWSFAACASASDWV